MLAIGIGLGCLLGLHLTRVKADDWISQQPTYLLIADTPIIELPPATPIPTPTATPTPTALPPPPPAIRLSIPEIDLNSSIIEVSPLEIFDSSGQMASVWDSAAYAVGHYETSGNPGGGRNIVLAGHNNTLGEVFRYLDRLTPGDGLILYTEDREFDYVVQKKYIIPFVGDEDTGNAQLQAYSAPQSTEMVTLISCWPYATNANRIVVVALPPTD